MVPLILHDLALSLSLTLNNKSKTDFINFDFVKAFGSISHDLILKILSTKVGGLMRRFISRHVQQQVNIGDVASSKLPV